MTKSKLIPLLAFAFAPLATAAVLTVDGSTKFVELDDSNALTENAYFVGYEAGDPTYPSSFSSNFLVTASDGTSALSSAQQLINVPFTTDQGAAFQFFLDSQETNNNELIGITAISVYYVTKAQFDDATDDTTQRTLVWELASTGDTIEVNPVSSVTQTAKPLGNGADLSLHVPFSLLPDGALGEDYVYFEITQTDGNNGNDEWVYAAGYGAGATVTLNQVTLTDDIDTIEETFAVPEPSASLFALLGGLALLRRRRG